MGLVANIGHGCDLLGPTVRDRARRIAPHSSNNSSCHEELRRRLRDDLGATPAPELRALQEQLLRR